MKINIQVLGVFSTFFFLIVWMSLEKVKLLKTYDISFWGKVLLGYNSRLKVYNLHKRKVLVPNKILQSCILYLYTIFV